jgi:hypothetical protein
MTMPDNPTAPFEGQSAVTETVDARRTSGARAQIREVKDQVVGEAKNSFRQARDSAASSLTQSRQQAAERVGGLASAIRSTSDHLRSENQPRVADLTESLAEQAERLSSYLRDRDFGAFQADLQNFARQRPAIAIGAALALGMLAARFFKSSPQRGDDGEPYRGGRYDESERRGSYEGGYGYTGGYGSAESTGGGYVGA